MRDVLLGNIVGLARTFETSKAAAEVNGQLSKVTEGKENTVPGSILSGAQQTLLDATRRRRMFEASVANYERSHAQRNIFDILGHLDDGDSDVLRMRALLDDAVNNLEIPQKLKSISPKVAKPSSRLARLSTPKQSKVASRQPQKSINQRPSSLPRTSTVATATSPHGRSTGLADIVDFSTTRTTTAPLMKRSKVVLPSNISPRGMRQYSIWPTEKTQMFTSPVLQSTTTAKTTVVGSAGLTPSDLREILDAALKDHLARQMPLTEPSQIHSQLRDVNVGICSQDFMEEEALSPIHSPAKITLIDRASSPKPIAESSEMVSCGNSVQSVGKPRSSSLPSIMSEVIVTLEKLRMGTQSPILADTKEVSTPVILTKVEEGEESEERDGLSLTEPHTFSDGVWLDVDRSEGEAGGVAMFGAEEIADLARESETTNSASEAIGNRSEGEFTLDHVNGQLGVWVAPWRDPLLHLIALNAAGKNSRLPWNQQHKIQKIAQRLKCRDDNQTCCSSAEDLSWVEGMAGRVDASSPPSTATNGVRSVGEVILPISVKQLLQKQQLRRTILAKSSQRMRQRDASISDEEDTLRGVVKEAPKEKQDLLSAVKSLFDEESKGIKNDEIDEEGSLESQVDSTSKDDSTFDIDHEAPSYFPKGSL
ncbi:unnamed protein product [Taenia asiatica]|uniref:JmjC domain-containing protein n=1 Tax=Taenia asiatica TaxID=60517 RepID=A0A0R3VT53_TAEAS|nr:unnamed protein product [Taenia asiatica]